MDKRNKRIKEAAKLRKSALVMGVGRSGTTAIYNSLQEILEDQYPGTIDYVYEPFLWDREIFNRPYGEFTNEFRYVSSYSIDGLYHDKQIPHLLRDGDIVPPVSKLWLKETLTPRNGKKHYLGKMIRANGRLPLIRELSPKTKIIFVVRNPVDVLNSSLQSFSFYGTEFHACDYSRFVTNASSFFDHELSTHPGTLPEYQEEYLYWYYSNRAFLQSAHHDPANVLSLSYEYYVSNRGLAIEQICNFLGLEYKEDYAQISEKQVGPVKQKLPYLTQEEYEFLVRKLADYQIMLEKVLLSTDSRVEDLVRYQGCHDNTRNRRPEKLQLFNSFYANTALRTLNQERDDLLAGLNKLRHAYNQLQNSYNHLQNSKRVRLINKLFSPLDKFRSWRSGKDDSL
jgi:hypothetical protein